MSQTRKLEDSLRSVGVLVAIPYTIIAVTHLTTDNLQIDYATSSLTKQIPLDIYRILSPFLIIGTFANNFSNLGSSFDSMIDGMNTFYNTGYKDLKNWISGVKSKNIGHVTGAFFGTAVAAYFIHCNKINSNSIFLLSFGEENSILNWLFRMGAIPYIAGAFSNAFSQMTEGGADLISGSIAVTHSLKQKISNCYQTLFGKNNSLTQYLNEDKFSEEIQGEYQPLIFSK